MPSWGAKFLLGLFTRFRGRNRTDYQTAVERWYGSQVAIGSASVADVAEAEIECEVRLYLPRVADIPGKRLSGPRPPPGKPNAASSVTNPGRCPETNGVRVRRRIGVDLPRRLLRQAGSVELSVNAGPSAREACIASALDVVEASAVTDDVFSPDPAAVVLDLMIRSEEWSEEPGSPGRNRNRQSPRRRY